MPTAIDFVFAFLLLVVASIVEYVYFWPRFRADTTSGDPEARTRGYRRGVAGQWFFAASALAIWLGYGRPWSSLRLAVPHGWPLAIGTIFVLATLALMGLQLWSVVRLSPEQRVAARPRLRGVAFMLPRTRGEEIWFLVLSITAGFCEELLYRGYLVWFFAPWLGAGAAMALVVVIFGVSHIYQGRKGAVKATIAGAVMALIVVATGSLIPAMLVHALVDIGGGTTGYLLFRDQSAPNAAPAPAVPAAGDATLPAGGATRALSLEAP